MPVGKRNDISQHHSEMAAGDIGVNIDAEERKNFLLNDQEIGAKKEIRTRMRSGSRDNRKFEADKRNLAESHAKRLKVAKSSRITINADDKVKPSRFARAMAIESQIDLTLSNAQTDSQSNGI